jgi:hypothetical protein
MIRLSSKYGSLDVSQLYGTPRPVKRVGFRRNYFQFYADTSMMITILFVRRKPEEYVTLVALTTVRYFYAGLEFQPVI